MLYIYIFAIDNIIFIFSYLSPDQPSAYGLLRNSNLFIHFWIKRNLRLDVWAIFDTLPVHMGCSCEWSTWCFSVHLMTMWETFPNLQFSNWHVTSVEFSGKNWDSSFPSRLEMTDGGTKGIFLLVFWNLFYWYNVHHILKLTTFFASNMPNSVCGSWISTKYHTLHCLNSSFTLGLHCYWQADQAVA